MVGRLRRRELDRHERITEQLAQRGEAVADELVLREAQPENLASGRGAARDHLGVIKLVLNSHGGRASLDQIQKELVPDVITDDWKKWIEVAKREMKKDGHFIVPLKKTDPIIYQAQETTLTQRVMDKFKAAKGLKARLVEAAELLKSVDDLENKAGTVGEAVATLNAEIASHQRTQPALALEAIFLRDELKKAAGLAAAASVDRGCESARTGEPSPSSLRRVI